MASVHVTWLDIVNCRRSILASATAEALIVGECNSSSWRCYSRVCFLFCFMSSISFISVFWPPCLFSLLLCAFISRNSIDPQLKSLRHAIPNPLYGFTLDRQVPTAVACRAQRHRASELPYIIDLDRSQLTPDALISRKQLPSSSDCHQQYPLRSNSTN